LVLLLRRRRRRRLFAQKEKYTITEKETHTARLQFI